MERTDDNDNANDGDNNNDGDNDKDDDKANEIIFKNVYEYLVSVG